MRRKLYGIAEDDRVEDAVADAVSAAVSPAEEHNFHSRWHYLVMHYKRMRNKTLIRILK